VRDGGDLGRVQLERQIRLRLRIGRVLGHHVGVVGEAGLAHVFDAVRRGGAPGQQVAQEKALVRRRHDARNALRLDQSAGRGVVAGDRRLDGETALHAGVEILAGIGRGNHFADGQGFGRHAAALLQLGDDLLGGLEVGLQLALGDQQLVDLGLGFFGQLRMGADIGLGLLSMLLQLLVHLPEAGVDVLDVVVDLGH